MIASKGQIADIESAACAAYPEEAVMIITSGGEVVPLNNVATDPCEEFAVSQKEWGEVSRNAIVLVHSHPDGPLFPSCADMRTQQALDIPFGIVEATPHGAGGYFEWGGESESIMERPFRHGVTDCYALIRDYYATELHITLPDFPRSWEWWDNGENLYIDGYVSAGFKTVQKESLSQGDMLMFAVRGRTPCHAAIYIGDGKILHHLGGKKGYDPSRKPMIDSLHRWSKYITGVYHHKENLS